MKTIRITGLEGEVNMDTLHKGIYFIMGKPECIRLMIGGTSYGPVHFFEDEPVTWANYSREIGAEEAIIADAWFHGEAVARAWEAYEKARALTWEAYGSRGARDEAVAQAEEVYLKAKAQAKKMEEKRLIDGELLTLTELQGKLSGCPTKHILAKWAQAE